MKFEPKNYIAKNDNTYVAPTRFTKNTEKEPSTNEIEYVPASKTMKNGKIEFTKPSYKYNPGAGYVSNADPIAEFVIGNAVLGKPTQYLLDKGLKTVIGKTSGELINQTANAAKKEISSGINTIKKVPTNYKDLKNLNDFAFKYQYKPPKANVFQSKKIDNAYKTVLDQHNTFVRGISVSDKSLSNQNIKNQLTNSKIYNPSSNGIVPKEKIAEYMATHIPGETGYGRSGIDSNEFRSGLYTSNSLDTAKGYTYGDGYIATVKRPVNYSSSNRKDWLESGDFSIGAKINNDAYTEEARALKGKILNNYLNEKNILQERRSNLQNYIVDRYPDKYPLKLKLDIQNNFHNYKTIQEKQFYRSKLNEIEEMMSNLSHKTYKKYHEKELPLTSKFYDDIYKIDDGSKNTIEFGMNKTSLTKEKFSRGLNKKLIQVKANPYQHFIFTGQPGEKVLDLVKLEQFSSGINDYTRAHTGLWSEGLSRKSYKNGGLIKLFNK